MSSSTHQPVARIRCAPCRITCDTLRGVRGFFTEGCRRFDRYWFREQPPHAAAIFRIMLGLYFLAIWLPRCTVVDLFYSSDGVAWPYIGTPTHFPTGVREWLGFLTQPPPVALAWVIYACMIAVIVLFTIGLFTRPALGVFVGLYMYYWLLALHRVEGSVDRVAWLISVFLAMSQCDAVYSIAAHRRRQRGEPAIKRIAYWPIRLITLQIIFMYLGTGIFKIMSKNWASSEIIYYVLQLDYTTDLGYWVAQRKLPASVFQLAILMTILPEVWSPLLLLHRWWQKVFFIWGFCFHLTNALLLGLWHFMIMVIPYVLFLEPVRVKRWCRRWS